MLILVGVLAASGDVAGSPTTTRAEAWGLNSAGQLGNGTTTNSVSPVLVEASEDAAAIVSGSAHACAILAGSVACWGNNASGQLGNGTTTSSTVPVVIAEIDGVRALAAAGSYSCAIVSGGRVNCWGLNQLGQLGNGTTVDSSAPVEVSGIEDAVELATGDFHACAVSSSGSVQCWGFNGFGQLGNGTTNSSTTPVNVTGIAGAVAIAAGSSHTCALLADSTVRCWGANVEGQLGNGTNTGSSSPVTAGVTGASVIAARNNTTCAVASGAVRCWGNNALGQLGDGTTTSRSTPVTVSGIGDAVAVATGSHSCAVASVGEVRCWGNNLFGQLGDGTTTNRLTPVLVAGLENAFAVAIGAQFTAALTDVPDGGGVGDVTAPVITTPADRRVEATTPRGAFVLAPGGTALQATAVDDSGVAPVMSCGPRGAFSVTGAVARVDLSGTYPVGRTTLTCTAVDAAGNVATDDFAVNVVDTTAPRYISVGFDRYMSGPPRFFSATGPSGARVTWSGPAFDLVDGTITPECTHENGSFFPLGTTSLTCTATDAAGNETSITETVLVRDWLLPVVTQLPDMFVVGTNCLSFFPDGSCALRGVVLSSVAWPRLTTAVDAVDGVLTAVCSPLVSSPTVSVGNQAMIQCVARDRAGNTQASIFFVHVVSAATSRRAQTISFELDKETLGTKPFRVTATAEPSGLPVTFKPGPDSVCTVTPPGDVRGPGVVEFDAGMGDCTIVATQLGDETYLPADPVTRSFDVSTARNDPRNVPIGERLDSNWFNWLDRDTDGIPDYWENNRGVWVAPWTTPEGNNHGESVFLPLPLADPARKNVYVHVASVEGHALSPSVYAQVWNAFDRAPVITPGGRAGVSLWIEHGNPIPLSSVPPETPSTLEPLRCLLYGLSGLPYKGCVVNAAIGFNASGRGGGRGVPPIFRYACSCPPFDDGAGAAVAFSDPAQLRSSLGGTHFAVGLTSSRARFLAAFLWLIFDERVAERGQAANFMHELGHLLGLDHHGATTEPRNSPSYKSVMSYAYSFTGVYETDEEQGRLDYAPNNSPVYADWLQAIYTYGFGGLSYDAYRNAFPTIDETPAEEDPIDEILAGVDPETVAALKADLADDDAADHLALFNAFAGAYRDLEPPSTIVQLSPAAPDGNEAWYTQAPTLSVTANDAASAVAETRCALDPVVEPAGFDDLPEGPCPYLGAGALVPDGRHVLFAASEDEAGNAEAAVRIAFKVDTTDPTLTLAGNQGSYQLTQTVAITCAAEDALSGVAGSTCADVDAPAWKFGPGAETLTAGAADLAGNTSALSASFTVVVSQSELCKLTTQLVKGSARYQALKPAQKAIVDAALKAACAILDKVVPQLSPSKKASYVSSYQSAVQKLARDGWLTQQQADVLKTLAGAL
jgi:alpha-tubulin suppressor-like RCC1 family protein